MNRTFEKERPVRHAIKIKTIGKNYSSGKLISRGTWYKNGDLFQNFFQMVFRQNEKQKLEFEKKMTSSNQPKSILKMKKFEEEVMLDYIRQLFCRKFKHNKT